MNNVAKYPTKDAFDANKAQMAADWDKNYGSRLKPLGEEFAQKKEAIFKEIKERDGIDLAAQGYSRVGEYNPYTGDYYYKYYAKDGSVKWAEWKDDADGYQKYQQDVETYRRRQLSKGDDLKSEASKLTDLSNGFDRSRQSGSQQLESLAGAVNKINFGGSWSGGDNTGNGNSVGLTLQLQRNHYVLMEPLGGFIFRRRLMATDGPTNLRAKQTTESTS